MKALSQQEILRREKRQQLIDMGIDPYPAACFAVNMNTGLIKSHYEGSSKAFDCVQLAGRLMSIRVMGSASFAELQDDCGRIQLYLRRDDLCAGEDKSLYNVVFKKLLDIGDIIGVEGFVFKTQVGEISVHVKMFKLLSKSLKPLPIVKTSINEQGREKVHDAFTDSEQRYRQRYVDLVVNPEVKEIFRQRAKLMNTMRDYLNESGYIEVETPILQPLYGGASARPFKTYHNTLDTTLYLRIANELYLKRLIVGGYEGVYEFAKDFRNEGMGRFHNPEFTQMELYVAYKDYEWMMCLVEEMLEKIALALHGKTTVQLGDYTIDFKRPWKRFTLFEAIEHFTGINICGMDECALRETAEKLNIPIDSRMGKGKLIDEIFGGCCESKLIDPTFIMDYPVEMSPLAKRHRLKKGFVERFEVICNGKEICNSFSELNDPIEQRQRFEDQLELVNRGDEEAMFLDEDFLRSLSYGMPPASGLGIGIDRLTMVMTDSFSIRDVIFFPQMKAERRLQVAGIKDYESIGVREELVPILQGLDLYTIEDVQRYNPNKLLNDLCVMRKKMNLKNVVVPTLLEVESWMF